jgi:hypothetical protein
MAWRQYGLYRNEMAVGAYRRNRMAWRHLAIILSGVWRIWLCNGYLEK